VCCRRRRSAQRSRRRRGVADGRGLRIAVTPHSAFDTPEGLLHFVARLRDLSGGKPTGFKLAIGPSWEWFAIAKAMTTTGIPAGTSSSSMAAKAATGAAPLEFTDHVGAPLREALLLVHNTLVGPQICASDPHRRQRQGHHGGRYRAHAGAWGRLVHAARGFMFALAASVAKLPHRPLPDRRRDTGAARWNKLDVPDKSTRVASFHENTLIALKELVQATGLTHPGADRGGAT